MAGTKNGGKLAARTNKMRYGANFYEAIGKLGGAKSRGGGFSYMARRDPEAHRQVSSKGGKAERIKL